MIIERGEFLYGLSAVVHYGTRVLLRGSGTRDVSSILREYDRPRRREEWRDDLSIDDLIRGDSSRREYVLLHDRLVRATERQVRAVLLEGLVCAAHRFVDSAESGTIVEFGCGTGRNLFFLAERFPNARLLGLELSPATVRRASERAAPYDGRVEVRVADMTRPLDLPEDALFAYSVHALEQLGTGVRPALESMLRARRGAALFEPCAELAPRGLRGAAMRLRIRNAGYLQGLLATLIDLGACVVVAERMGIGRNPLNETCRVIVDTAASRLDGRAFTAPSDAGASTTAGSVPRARRE